MTLQYKIFILSLLNINAIIILNLLLRNASNKVLRNQPYAEILNGYSKAKWDRFVTDGWPLENSAHQQQLYIYALKRGYRRYIGILNIFTLQL